MTTITIIPDIGGTFKVADWSEGGVVKTMDIAIVKPEPFEITITDADRAGGKTNTDIIRQKLKDLVEESIEVGMASDVNVLIEEELDSPPIKIYRDQDWREAIKARGRNSFQIIKIKENGNRINLKSFGKERVFKLAPEELVYDNTKYFEPDKENLLNIKTAGEASCAFQYIYQKFGNKPGFKKKARDFETIKKLSTTDPPQFRNWITQYQKDYNLESLGLETQYACVDIESFEDELFNLDVLEIEPDNYTEEELYNSMSVIDIIRWCMWAGVSCYIVDYDGHYYLSYNHGQISKDYTDKKKTTRFSMVLKVKNKHAYFVDDAALKKSASLTLTNYNIEDFDSAKSHKLKKNKKDYPKLPEKKGKDYDWELEVEEEAEEQYLQFLEWEKEIKEWIKENRNQFYISPFFKQKEYAGLTGGQLHSELFDERNWSCMSDINPRDDLNGCLEQIAQSTYKKNPPPLPEEFLQEENKTFYLEAKNLNGIISYIKTHHGISPGTMSGAYPHQIDRATYGKTKLMSRRCNTNLWSDRILQPGKLEYIYTKYPELDQRRLPTATSVAEQIFKKYYKHDKQYSSMFNSNTKRAFFDGEIKADNRVIKEQVDSDVFSIDLKRAYTNSLREPDVEWGVYDGICQFNKYNGTFHSECFYLVREKVDEYPLRGLKGLVLYHGVFLRNILEKVDIEYIIYPVKKKPVDYFKKFVEECEEFDEESGGIISSKSLINNFIGGMKNQDKIQNYKIKETESNTTMARAFYTGSIVSNLSHRKDRVECKLIADPIIVHNIQSAQPIRLQVIDSINEKLYHLYLDYKIVFGRCPIVMTRTDALYIQDTDRTEEEIIDFCDKQTILCEKERDIPADIWEYKYNPTTQKQVNYNINQWLETIDIDKAWSLTGGAKALFNIIHTGGGALINGEAGVGKSELMNYISTEFEENAKNYKWVKLIIKLTSSNPFAELEDWRDEFPCKAIKLAPTNKAKNRIGADTLHRGLGIPVMEVDIDAEAQENLDDPVGYFEEKLARIVGGYVKGSDGKTCMKPCHDYICIDEISMINGYFWSMLLAIKHRAPRIKFLLCGDILRQLPPVGEENRNFIGSYLIKELSNFQQINLNYNFRNKLKGNILWDDWSLNPERFQITPEAPPTKINLCRLNNTRKKVIEDWNNLLKPIGNKLSVYDFEGYAPFKKNHPIYKPDGQTPEIYFMMGTPMIANKSLKELGVAKNEIWDISNIEDDKIELSYEGKKITQSREELYNNFYSGYAITIHKSQGDTYEDKYTIWDWGRLSGDKRLDRKLRYVAQSRSKKPEINIYYR